MKKIPLLAFLLFITSCSTDDDADVDFTVKSLPPGLIKLFEEEKYNLFYYKGSIPEKIETNFRKCMEFEPSEEIMLIIDTGIWWDKCYGLAITQKGFHVNNKPDFKYSDDLNGYRFIPFDYYRKDNFRVGFANNYWGGKIRKEVSIDYVELKPSFGLLLAYQSIEDSFTIAYFLALLIDAIQGRNLPTSDELQESMALYSVYEEQPKNKRNKAEIGQFISDVASLAMVYYVVTADKKSCQMPRKPKKPNYGLLTLNRAPSSAYAKSQSKYNKSRARYRRDYEKAQSECKSKRSDLELLFELID
ncbi:MAG: hypothetical protein P8L74_05325 [Gammaproteobacteria bacterium]|nr:hypothetical protein [Gammaproteobacteria bacterium]